MKVGRIAGQYAKPGLRPRDPRRVTLPAYARRRRERLRLHPESGPRPAAAGRRLQLLGGHAQPRPCLRHRRVRRPPPAHAWNTDFVRESPVGQRYEQIASEIERALTFMKAIGADPDEFHRVDFHSSHEALVLEYEHA